MITSTSPLLERQLLLQLGDRLRRLRKSQGLGTVEMAQRADMTRNTYAPLSLAIQAHRWATMCA